MVREGAGGWLGVRRCEAKSVEAKAMVEAIVKACGGSCENSRPYKGEVGNKVLYGSSSGSGHEVVVDVGEVGRVTDAPRRRSVLWKTIS